MDSEIVWVVCHCHWLHKWFGHRYTLHASSIDETLIGATLWAIRSKCLLRSSQNKRQFLWNHALLKWLVFQPLGESQSHLSTFLWCQAVELLRRTPVLVMQTRRWQLLASSKGPRKRKFRTPFAAWWTYCYCNSITLQRRQFYHNWRAISY